MDKKIMTLCCVYDDTRILLGMKKRGFGEGRWNGFGGKVHEGETIEEATKRELEEESGIKVEKIDKRGVLVFEFEGNPEKLEMHIFSSNTFSGEPIETEEMKPQWFSLDKIPHDSMWPDDPYWIPSMLSGKNFSGEFLFDSDGKTVLEYEFKESY
jgi:8-oxo-dGTP diphosphatase / 2-hydroxy-dATP diphosphatase